MMINKARPLLVLMIIVALFPIMFIQVDSVYSQSEYRVLLFIIPGLPLNYFNETLSPIYNNWNKTFLIRIDTEPPYTLLYHELLLINTTWDFSKKLVLIDSVRVGNESTEPYKAIDYKQLNNTWGFLTTVFINTRSVDPYIHNRTLNPYYNYTYRYFPPQLLTLRINETIKWDLLNTTINITYINNTYRLTIEGYVRNSLFKNTTLDTDPVLINTTSANLTIHRGVYNIKFRIVNVNDTHITVFTPGSLEMYKWLSPFYGIYTKPVTPSLPIEFFPYIGVDDIEWVFNETISFYTDMFTYAVRHRDASLYVFSIPLYEDINKALINNYINTSIALNLTRYLISFVNRVYELIKTRLGQTYLAIYVPYVYSNITLNSIEISNLEYIAPGLYRALNITSVLTDLITHNVDHRIVKHYSEYYVLIKYRNYSINSINYIDNGYFIIYPSSSAVENMFIDSRTIIGYLTVFARGYGIGFIDINQVVRSLSSEVRNLRDQVVSLNRTITSLNATLSNTELELSRCRSSYLNLSGLVRDLKNEIDAVKNRETQWMIYALAGTASIFAVIVVMYLIGLRALKKK